LLAVHREDRLLPAAVVAPGKVQGRYREGTGKVQGRYTERTGCSRRQSSHQTGLEERVQGRYREGTGKVQGRYAPDGSRRESLDPYAIGGRGRLDFRPRAEQACERPP
jgi:hypothetical protein